MYTKEPHQDWPNCWDIYGPSEDFVCCVYDEGAANALLFHLNRE